MLTDEQKRELKKVGDAVGVPNFVDMIEEISLSRTRELEDAGVNYKARKPQGFWAQFREATTPKATKDVPAPAKPTLPGKIEAAVNAANAGGPDMRGFAAQTSIGRKVASGGDEATSEAVAQILQPQVDAIIALAKVCGEQLAVISKRLEDIDHRVDNVEEVQSVKAMFPWDLGLPARPTVRYDVDLSPGGNSHAKAGKPFDWNAFGNTFGGRA